MGPKKTSLRNVLTVTCWLLAAFLMMLAPVVSANRGQASAGQSVAGVWKVHDVGYAPWTLKFQVDGDVVQGTVQQTRRLHILPFIPPSPFEPAKIYDGSIAGDTISFKCDSPDHHGDRTISFTGVIQGNQITFTRKVTVKPGGFRGENGIFGALGASHFTAIRDSHS